MSILVPSSSWQYYAVNILTGEWLHRDLPLQGVQITETLSGPGAISATIDPDLAVLKNADGSPILDEWSSLIVAEADDEVRAAGILVTANSTGPSLSLDCMGVAGYPAGQILEDSLSYTGAGSIAAGGHGVDPLTVARDLWASLQSKPDAGLGVVLDDATSAYSVGSFTNVQAQQKDTAHPDGSTDPKEVGEDVPINRVWTPQDKLPTPAQGKALSWYYTLNWWDSVDIGSQIDSLAKQAPFDYIETPEWASSAKDEVVLRIRLGSPRLGTRRDNLRFVEGENISQVVPVLRSGDDYANYVYALGSGDGQAQIRTAASQRDGRLRRMGTLTDTSKLTVDSLKAAATTQLGLSNKLLNITGFTVRSHPNAPIGSFQVGDDVLVQTHVGWQPMSLWVRITAAAISPDSGDIAVTCSRSDRFSYSPGSVS